MEVFIKDNLIYIEKSNFIQGLTRRIDELGMIVIPFEIRRQLNISETNKFEIYLEGTKIILKKI
ncbi:MAG: AbrB/MazE/SpoVT family DNA-binding domain-containing protein [Clostridia bacterium]|nr:AbrB/MazE/SpoVT family DNA-binding domain-containing protein [Clostridia bacterium]